MPAPAAPPPAPAKTDAAGIVPPAQVPAASVAPPVEATPPKPGSAREAIFKTLRDKYAKPEPGAPADTPPAPAPAPAATPPAPAAATPPKPADTPPGSPPEPDRSKTKPDKDFWKAFDSWKSRAIKAEEALAAPQGMADPERKALSERATAAEARVKELEEHIRFVDYSKHPEFEEKYRKPFIQKWEQAVAEISEIAIKDPETGNMRQATVHDLAKICALPFGDAGSLAQELFGDLAPYIMNYRKEIKNLEASQAQALEEAKKKGAEHEQKLTAQQQRTMGEIKNQIETVWNKVNETALNDPTYGKWFKPVEGNQEVNDRLAKGFKLVDRAFSEDPRDPRLSPEERALVVKRHAAVRNRAAAFGRVIYENGQLVSRIGELEKELAGFKKSTPPAIGQPAGQPAAAAPSGWNAIREGLKKIAK